MYIILAILAYGILIIVHELGHFLAAKACGVKVKEFSVGLGPQLWHRQSGETVYSLRLLPLGGFCAMEGEEEESDDPRAFTRQSGWKRFLILFAGGAMNFLLGLLLICCFYSDAAGYSSPVIGGFQEGCPYEGDLLPGDTVLRVNGSRIYFAANFQEEAARDPDGDLDLVIRRDGRRLRLDGYHLTPLDYTMEDGSVRTLYGISFRVERATLFSTIKYSWRTSLGFVRMAREGLEYLFSGQASVSDVTGVVGLVDIINETGQSADTTSEGVREVVFLIAFIAVNLFFMNLLPIPGLDGGHILTLILTGIIEAVTGKKLDPRYEGFIHYIGLILLFGLMIVVFFNDIVRIIKR